MTTPAEHADALAKEYGVYVATQTIYLEGARAFNVGDAVPVSHVERGVVSAEQVAKQSTKAAQAATSSKES